MRTLSVVIFSLFSIGIPAAEGESPPAVELETESRVSALLSAEEVRDELGSILGRLVPLVDSGEATYETIRDDLEAILALRSRAVGESREGLTGLAASFMLEVGATQRGEKLLREDLAVLTTDEAKLQAYLLLGKIQVGKDDGEAQLDALIAEAKGAGLDARMLSYLDGLKARAAVKVGLPLPSIKGIGLDGGVIDTSELANRKKVVLVDFWATWCEPYAAQIPGRLAIYENWHDRGLEIIGVSLDLDEVALREFMEARGMTWQQYFDGKSWQSQVASAFGVTRLPVSFLAGADGIVVEIDPSGEKLEKVISRLLGGRSGSADSSSPSSSP